MPGVLIGWQAVAMWAIILLGTIAPLGQAWLSGLTLIHRDQTSYFAPLRWLAGQALREGRLPLWNPYCATGMPYLAQMTHGALHPLSIAVAFLFPGDGLDPLIGAYILAAGLGAGAFARGLGASRQASVLAAFAYGLSGYMLSMTSNMNNLTGTASVPWILVGLRAAGRDRTAVAFAGGALAVTAGALSGDVQELAVATALGLVLALDGGGRRGASLAMAAVGIGALLAAVQLVPSWSFLPLTNRVLPLPDYDVNQWDLAPWRLVEFFSPGFFWVPEDGTLAAPVFLALGHPTWFNIPMAESVFVGGATIFLAVAGTRGSRTARVLAVSSIVVLWFAMGRHLGARVVQNMLPIASGFRYGEKYLPTFLACVAALAALGADRLVSDTRAARRALVAAGSLCGVLLAAWLFFALRGPLFESLGVQEYEAIRAHLLRGLPHAFVAVLALAGCLWAAMRGKGAVALAGMAAIVWCAAFATASYALRPGHPEARIAVAPPAITAPPPGPRVMNPVIPHQRKPLPGWDIIDQFNFDVLSSLGANTNARYRIDNFGVDTGFYPIRWFRLFGAFGESMPYVARRYAVTHLIFPSPQTEKGRALAAFYTQDASALGIDPRNGMEIWAVPHRAWAVFPQEMIAVPDFERALAELKRDIRAGRETAVIETSGPLPTGPGRVLSVNRELEQIEIIAETTADATLIVNDAFWPGWRAWIDGKETGIFPADVLVRAVYWPAGRHSLVMRYDPPEVRVGEWLSVAGFAALIGACFVLRRFSIGAQHRRTAA